MSWGFPFQRGSPHLVLQLVEVACQISFDGRYARQPPAANGSLGSASEVGPRRHLERRISLAERLLLLPSAAGNDIRALRGRLIHRKSMATLGAP